MRRRVVVERDVEHRPATAARPSHRSGSAGRRHDEIAADVGLEVDREIVAACPPAPGSAQEAGHADPFALARQPARVERLDAVDRRDRGRQRGIPAADDQIDLGRRCERPNVADGLERHHEIANPLEAKQQNAPRRSLARAGERPHDRRRDGQGGIRHAHERALTEVRNLQQDICPRIRGDSRILSAVAPPVRAIRAVGGSTSR